VHRKGKGSYSKWVQGPDSIVVLAQLRWRGEEDAADRHVEVPRKIYPVGAYVCICVRVVWRPVSERSLEPLESMSVMYPCCIASRSSLAFMWD